MEELVDSALARINVEAFDDLDQEKLRTVLESIIVENGEGKWVLGVKNTRERKELAERLQTLFEEKQVGRRLDDYFSIFKEKYHPKPEKAGKGIASVAYKLEDGPDLVLIEGGRRRPGGMDTATYIAPFLVHLMLFLYFRDVKGLPESIIPIVEIKRIDVVDGLGGVILEEYGGETFDKIVEGGQYAKFHKHFCSFLYTLRTFRGDLNLNHTDLHISNICFKDVEHVVKYGKNEYSLPVCKFIDLGTMCSFQSDFEGFSVENHCNDPEEDVFQFLSFYFMTNPVDLENLRESTKQHLERLIPTLQVGGLNQLERRFPILLKAMEFMSKNKSSIAGMYAQNINAYTRYGYPLDPNLELPEKKIAAQKISEKLHAEINLVDLMAFCFENQIVRERGRGLMEIAFP